LALKTIGIAIFSISVLVSFGLTSNQAFAGDVVFSLPTTCQDCDDLKDLFWSACAGDIGLSEVITTSCEELALILETCRPLFCPAVGGDMIQMQTTSILAAGAQYTAAWMIPVIVAAVGIGIVIARKF